MFAVSDEYLEEYDKRRLIEKGKLGGNVRRKRQLEKYNAYKQELRYIASKLDFRLPNGCFCIIFNIPMPASWRPKRRTEMVGKPHQSKPDVDNCIKSLWDGLIPPKNKSKGEKGRDDKEIWSFAAIKRWVEPENSCIEIIEYNEEDFLFNFQQILKR